MEGMWIPQSGCIPELLPEMKTRIVVYIDAGAIYSCVFKYSSHNSRIGWLAALLKEFFLFSAFLFAQISVVVRTYNVA